VVVEEAEGALLAITNSSHRPRLLCSKVHLKPCRIKDIPWDKPRWGEATDLATGVARQVHRNFGNRLTH
jgi:hypothetical protein